MTNAGLNTAVKRPITEENPYKLCFVCLGNICRSPTAEGMFQHLVNKRGLQHYFEIDSAGTSAYHIGESPNHYSQQIARSHGVKLQSKARQFEYFDLDYFDLILAMDTENLQNIKSLDKKGHSTEKVSLLRDFDPEPGDGEVPDPYFGGMKGFERVFNIIKRTSNHLLDQLEEHIREDLKEPTNPDISH